jgi:hypothetical protein
MTIKYTKWPLNIPNGHKIYQMTIRNSKFFQNISKLGFYGMKIYRMVFLGSWHSKGKIIEVLKKLPPYTPAVFDLMTRDSSGGYDTAMQTTPPGYECIFATLYTYVYFQTNRPKEVGGTDRCVSLFCGGILAAGTSWLHRNPHDFYSGANPTTLAL